MDELDGGIGGVVLPWYIFYFFVVGEEKPLTTLKKEFFLEFSLENNYNLDDFKEIILYCKKPFIVLNTSLSLL